MRKVHDFHGGIYPPERKALSSSVGIRRAPVPRRLVLPLSQHIGPPARPTVQEGDEVLGGQRLTDLTGLPVHAPTSGTIAAITDHPVPHASGLTGRCIVIDCDGEDRWIDLHPVPDFRTCDSRELVDRIFAAGIAGLGGAGFPSARKMPEGCEARIHTLIVNGTECEPYITSDDLLMREQGPRIVEGIEVLAHIVKPQTILIGIEDNKPEAVEAMRAAVQGRASMEVVVFPTKYPSGGEKQLIEILTGQQVPRGGLPSDLGILCQNVGTTAAIADAVLRGRPLVSRITTVTGKTPQNAGNFEVLLGTPMKDLLEFAQCRVPTDTGHAQRLIMGGPMMGVTMPSAESPIIKTSNCLLVPEPGELAPDHYAQACIRCGHCAEVCPAELLPQQLYWYARSRDHERLEEHNLGDCIECGACSYVCPSHIPLVQYYRASKAAIREKKADEQKSDQARLRFEARQERIERAAAEKEAKRAARKRAAMAKAADEASDDDPIKAAIARAQAKRAAQPSGTGGATDDDREKVARIEARLAKARSKLEADTGADPAVTAALEKAVATTEIKLQAAKDALASVEKASAESGKPATEVTEQA